MTMVVSPPLTRIWLDERGVAWVDETNTKVKEIVLDKMAFGWGPEEMHAQHSHLSLAQIHAALTYYYDHQAEVDAEIERDYQEAQAMKAQAEETPFKKRLRAMGKIS